MRPWYLYISFIELISLIRAGFQELSPFSSYLTDVLNPIQIPPPFSVSHSFQRESPKSKILTLIQNRILKLTWSLLKRDICKSLTQEILKILDHIFGMEHILTLESFKARMVSAPSQFSAFITQIHHNFQMQNEIKSLNFDPFGSVQHFFPDQM